MAGRRVAAALAIALLLATGGAADEIPCIGCLANAAAARAEFEDEVWKKLLAGEAVAQELPGQADADGAAGAPREAAAAGIIKRSPEVVWAVLVDFERPRDFLPNVREIQLRRVEGNRLFLQQHLRVLLNDVRFGLIWELYPDLGEVRVSLDPSVPHDIEDTRGTYRLVPLEGNRWTLLRYRTAVDTGRSIPGPVERFLTRRSLPGVIRSLRDEIYRRHPAAP